MIHIIVYSTTNTAAKMYKKKKKKRKGKSHFKVTQEDDNGWTLVIHLKGCGRADPTHCSLCI
jgi:hypothetical protein